MTTTGPLYDLPQQTYRPNLSPGSTATVGDAATGSPAGPSSGTASVPDQLTTILPRTGEREVTFYNEGFCLVRLGPSGSSFSWQAGGSLLLPGDKLVMKVSDEIAGIAPPYCMGTISMMAGE